MPRVKSDSTVTHRIEFSPKERQLLEQYVAAEALSDLGDFAVKLIAASGIAFAGYGTYWLFREGWGFAEKAAETIENWWTGDGGAGFGESKVGVKEALLGKPTYQNEETGQVYHNPAAGIPILGPLFGAGINIGRSTSGWWN